jgi:alkylation response protein AidB-like acyl-CoA dehydrogenase
MSVDSIIVSPPEQVRSPAPSTDLATLAARLADEFRPIAAELDRSGAFPFANYRRMREAGYLRAGVPTELGGLGAGLLEIARAQQALARGDASTALAVNMHQFQVGIAADTWRRTHAVAVENLLRRVAREGIVLASTGAEAIVAADWTTSTIAERAEGGYRITGRKAFCSQAPVMDVLRVNALDTATGEIIVCSVGGRTDGLKIIETWNTTGMRATASHDVVLEGVWVPDAAVGARLPADGPMRHPALASVACWFLCLVSSVYLGIAEEARAEAYRALGRGGNSNFRAEALTDAVVGAMEVEFSTALAVRDQVVGALDTNRSDHQAALAQAILCKDVVTQHATRVVDHARELVGGRSFFRSSPLERLGRDMQAAGFHPPATPTSLQMIGERARQASLSNAARLSGSHQTLSTREGQAWSALQGQSERHTRAACR